MTRIAVFLVACLLYTCTVEQKKSLLLKSLSKETWHTFSNPHSKDRFSVEFVGADSTNKNTSLPYPDVLLGYLRLNVFAGNGNKIYTRQWDVSHIFSMTDSHYMGEEDKIKKLRKTMDHFFDESNFNGLEKLKIVGVMKSSDTLCVKDISLSPHSIGFSFPEEEDYCSLYSPQCKRVIMLRALKRDVLKKYNLL